MLGRLSLIAILPVFLLATPASALTKEQKMETCNFGADNQKLTGAKRKTFIAKCMSNRDDKRGPGPKAATTGAKVGAKPAGKPAVAPAAEPDETEPAEQK